MDEKVQEWAEGGVQLAGSLYKVSLALTGALKMPPSLCLPEPSISG